MKLKILLLSFLVTGLLAFMHLAGRPITNTGPKPKPKPKVENVVVLVARHKLDAVSEL